MLIIRGVPIPAKICLVHFSESVLMDDLRAFFFFDVCFSTFCTADVASDKKSSKQESKSYVLKDASLDPGFITFGFSTSGTSSISVEAAAIVFIALLIFLPKLSTAEKD